MRRQRAAWMGWLTAAAVAAALAGGCRSGRLGRDELPPLRLDSSAPYIEMPAAEEEAAANEAAARGQGRAETAPAGRGETTDIVPSAGGASYRLRPGDMIVVVLRTMQAEQFEMIVDENGDIKLPYIGQIKAAGRTASELESHIQSQYIDQKIYRYLTAHVLVPTRSYFVRGEVRQPGRFPLSGSVTVLQAIAAAGGYTDFADRSNIVLTRADKTYRLNGKDIERNPEKDIEVEAGDTIDVKRSWY